MGLAPGREACAGPTYCAVASLELMGILDALPASRRQGLIEWCVHRQVGVRFRIAMLPAQLPKNVGC